jgi:hypothetical protein
MTSHRLIQQTGQNNFCEAAVGVKRFLYAYPSTPRHTSSRSASFMSAFCPRSLMGECLSRPAHYWIR